MALKKKRFVRELQSGEMIDDIFVVRESSLRQARNGSMYMQAVLGDRTGDIQMRQWDAREEDSTIYVVAGYVRCQARVEEYRGRPQMVVQRAKVVAAADVDPGDFQQISDFPLADLEKELLQLIASLSDPHLRALLQALFHDKDFMTRFRLHPAGSKLHHAFVGGLLEHTTMLARTAAKVSEANPRLDRDLLITGAMLHDIGKMDEISAEADRAYTEEGRLMGHLILGLLRVDEAMRGIPDFPPRLRLLVHHLILSHHGTHEFGSPVLPCTPEAMALHLIDNIDAKTEAAVRSIATCPNEANAFTDRQFMFGNVGLYKRGRPTEEEAAAPRATSAQTAEPASGRGKSKRDAGPKLFD